MKLNEKEVQINYIVDLIEKYGMMYITHPNDNVKIFAASRLVDAEVAKRMTIINEDNKNECTIFVGHCNNPGIELADC